MRGVDYVFHAAALKQVPSCEFFPMEAVRTNIQGTDNVLEAAERQGVKKLVVLSTDKAVYPVNAMGLSKAMMEKLMVARSKACAAQHNVLRRSVRQRDVFAWLSDSAIRATDQVRTTDDGDRPEDDATTVAAFRGCQVGHFCNGTRWPRRYLRSKSTLPPRSRIWAKPCVICSTSPTKPKSSACATAKRPMRCSFLPPNFCGPRNSRSIIVCHSPAHWTTTPTSRRAMNNVYATDGYTSENAERLRVRQIEQLLLALPEIQAELSTWAGNRFLRKRAA